MKKMLTVCMAAGALFAQPLYAADTEWVGDYSDETNYWEEPFNWSAGWPEQNDTAIFNKGNQAYSVSYFNQGLNDSVGAINIVTDDVTLDLNQMTLATNPTMSGVRILNDQAYYNSDTPSLTLLNGTLATQRIILGQDYEGDATLTVGAGASIQGIADSWLIDNNYAPQIELANGRLNIIDGGQVYSRGINAPYGGGGLTRTAINVNGARSELISSGGIYLDGWETVSVTNGGRIQTQDLQIRYAPPTGSSPNEAISIDGANSNLTVTGRLALISTEDEYYGPGGPTSDADPVRMSVTNGATVTASDVSLGKPRDNCDYSACDGIPGTAELVIDDAQFTHTEAMEMGGENVTTLTVQNGGTLISQGRVHIGGYDSYGSSAEDGKGTVTITGAGSSWQANNNGSIHLSGPAESEINILDGATASIGQFTMGPGSYTSGNNNTLNVDGAGSSFVADQNYGIHIAEGPPDESDVTSTINVTNGGYVKLQASQEILIASDGNADINVQGAGSTLHLESENIQFVKYEGAADIDISDGAKLIIRDSQYGNVRLGNERADYGEVTLNITNGSELDAGDSTLILGGYESGSSGNPEPDDIIVTVTDSTLKAGEIDVYWNASLIIENSNIE
ncbi:MAG: hypothetical protein ACR2QG_02125, partial [Gammaproteobacteria bacterium]